MMKRLLLIVVALVGCKPDLGSPASLITGLRILGVKTEPPEVAPGMPVKTDLLVVDPSGRMSPSAMWALCLAHKPPAENNVVANDCSQQGKQLEPIAESGPRITVTIPPNACALNGPDTPPTKMGEPPVRARDADVTGGYYQPFEVKVAAANAFVLERISCNLPNVAVEVAKDFQMRYQTNTNPAFLKLLVGGLDLPAVTQGASPATVHVTPGQSVGFEAFWTPESRENFPVYDLASQMIVDRTEQLTVSWFATAGEFDRDQTGTTEGDKASSITNLWVAPPVAGPVHLWIVLRDNRGGLDFREYLLTVGP
jgi:hypothetical protein